MSNKAELYPSRNDIYMGETNNKGILKQCYGWHCRGALWKGRPRQSLERCLHNLWRLDRGKR